MKDETKVVNIKDKNKSKQDFDGIITKIKIKKQIPEIFFKKDDNISTRETKTKGKEIPLDDFFAALQDLKDVFLEVCDLEQKREKTTILCVTFAEKGVVITGQYELSKIKTSLTVNSPLIRYDKNAGGYEITKETKGKFEKLKNEAIRYLKGESAQMNLFKENK